MWFFSAEGRAGEVVKEQKKNQSITCPCIVNLSCLALQTRVQITAASAAFLGVRFPKGGYKHQGVLMYTFLGLYNFKRVSENEEFDENGL